MVHLYDLTHDPLELHNIANVNPQIVENMERQLQNLKDDHDEKSEQITSEERKKIEDELRKLGYI
jgi:vacuolar-type H+-ATPase subunit H